jgi:Arc/MetJ-type ribon-helix-helix transcriptional regulator
MIQTKFTLDESQEKFLQLFKHYGFKDRSAVVRVALDRLQREMELEELRQSAAIYAELYETDQELQTLTESAMHGWPE